MGCGRSTKTPMTGSYFVHCVNKGKVRISLVLDENELDGGCDERETDRKMRI